MKGSLKSLIVSNTFIQQTTHSVPLKGPAFQRVTSRSSSTYTIYHTRRPSPKHKFMPRSRRWLMTFAVGPLHPSSTIPKRLASSMRISSSNQKPEFPSRDGLSFVRVLIRLPLLITLTSSAVPGFLLTWSPGTRSSPGTTLMSTSSPTT